MRGFYCILADDTRVVVSVSNAYSCVFKADDVVKDAAVAAGNATAFIIKLGCGVLFN